MKVKLYCKAKFSERLYIIEARETKNYYIFDNGAKVLKRLMKSGPRFEETEYFIETPELLAKYQIQRKRAELESLMARTLYSLPVEMIDVFTGMLKDWNDKSRVRTVVSTETGHRRGGNDAADGGIGGMK